MKFFLLTIFLFSTLFAETLEISQKVDAITLESQHGTKQRLVESGIWIVAWDKENTTVVNRYFNDNEMSKNTNFIVDTSEIPSGIFSLFVHPKMKRFKHTILFSFDKQYNKKLPYKEDKITLLYIRDAKITKILFVDSAKELKESLK